MRLMILIQMATVLVLPHSTLGAQSKILTQRLQKIILCGVS